MTTVVVVAMAQSHISDPLTEDLRGVARWREDDRAYVRVSGLLDELAACLVDADVADYEGALPVPGGPEVVGEVVWRRAWSAKAVWRRTKVYVRAERRVP